MQNDLLNTKVPEVIQTMSIEELDRAILILEREKKKLQNEQNMAINATKEKLEIYKQKREIERNMPFGKKVVRYVKREWSFFLIKLSTLIQALHLATFIFYDPYSVEWMIGISRHVALTLTMSFAFAVLGLFERIMMSFNDD